MNSNKNLIPLTLFLLIFSLSCNNYGPFPDPGPDDPRWEFVGDWAFTEIYEDSRYVEVFDSTGQSGAEHVYSSTTNWSTVDGTIRFGREANELIVQYSANSDPFTVSCSADLFMGLYDLACVADCERAGTSDWSGGCIPSWTISEFSYSHFLSGSCVGGFYSSSKITTVRGVKNP